MGRMRQLEWNGYHNCRDLGGLSTPLSATGATIYGRIARGPRRELLTFQGWQDARNWGLRSVVDLRCAHEIGPRDGDPECPNDAYTGLSIVVSPTENQDDPEFQRVCFPILDSPEYWEHNWRLQAQLVRVALEAIAGADPGLLIHCAAGRDRTGMISALLLGNAGAEPECVAEDYAASVREMAGAPHHSPTADRQSAWSAEQVSQWLPDKMEIVRGVASQAPDILNSLGVSAETQLQLRGLLTDQELAGPTHMRILPE